MIGETMTPPNAAQPGCAAVDAASREPITARASGQAPAAAQAQTQAPAQAPAPIP